MTLGRTGSFVGTTGRARYVLTDRDGLRVTPSVPSRVDAAAAAVGSSAPPYERLDLATHVGDDADAVRANRSLVLELVGLPAHRLVVMDQVHGNDVAVVDRTSVAGGPPRADALVTTDTDLALAVLVADCVPVVLADEEAGVVAVAHAGRRGVESGVVGAVVRAMVEQGARPDRIAATVGPAICAACYEVPDEMRAAVTAVVPEAHATSSSGTPALHLRRAVVAQLARVGVTTVDAVGGCTAEDPTLYSYRRDGRTGRFAMLAWLPSSEAARDPGERG